MNERRETTRTHYIHRISFSVQERIVGLFVFAAIGILIWLLLSSGKSSIAFEDSFTLFGKLESVQGITKDTEVKISGLTAGTIESIDIKENNTVIITMSILSKYQKLLRTDSTAKLTNPGIAVLGGAIIHISAGDPNKPIMEDGNTITVTQTGGLKETLEKITPTFEQLKSSIEKVDALLAVIKPETISNTFNNMEGASKNLLDISTQVNSGDGLAGSMINDPDIKNDTKAIINNLVAITQSMEEIVSTLNKEIANMPELIDKIGPLLNQADKTIKATQRIWPLSSAIGDEKNNATLTSPAPAGD